MSEEELDQLVETSITELEAVLQWKVPAGTYACDIKRSCFKTDESQLSWSLNGMKSRFSVIKEDQPNAKISNVSGLVNLTYVSEKNTVSPLHIEDGDMWSIDYWIIFEFTSLQTYVDAVRRDLGTGNILDFSVGLFHLPYSLV